MGQSEQGQIIVSGALRTRTNINTAQSKGDYLVKWYENKTYRTYIKHVNMEIIQSITVRFCKLWIIYLSFLLSGVCLNSVFGEDWGKVDCILFFFVCVLNTPIIKLFVIPVWKLFMFWNMYSSLIFPNRKKFRKIVFFAFKLFFCIHWLLYVIHL